ncbi:hypothetical protein [Cyanobium sp. ATX 6F1]|uniref:hypothetical protein n=1 Tax=unclassified Cyanobium TaxID=2627006 RepID=UPI0020CD1E93|nr:hypothetical protein [Cyanobium sp. ATX 6F1]MCP9917860.1 hypothetical protein [Cyanobium sp. ATX 6F1]
MEISSTSLPSGHASSDAEQALHRIKELTQRDPAFAAALRQSHSTEEAAKLAHSHGITIKPEVLWRHRGTLLSGGLPTWPG